MCRRWPLRGGTIMFRHMRRRKMIEARFFLEIRDG